MQVQVEIRLYSSSYELFFINLILNKPLIHLLKREMLKYSQSLRNNTFKDVMPCIVYYLVERRLIPEKPSFTVYNGRTDRIISNS
jgi:hypothetical protein